MLYFCGVPSDSGPSSMAASSPLGHCFPYVKLKNTFSMGTIKQGILGGFSGKVGTVVGSSWKGISYMRSLAQSIKNPRTSAQVGQRTRMTAAVALVKAVIGFINIGYRKFAKHMSPYNAAMQEVLMSAISGDYPDIAIDYGAVVLSKGSLEPVAGGTTTKSAGKMTFAWEDNSTAGNAKATDKSMLLVYNPSKASSASLISGAARSSKTADLNIPTTWTGDTVHAYMAFVREDGSMVSTSKYLGEIAL
jgi:hypothetical protein